MPLIHQDGREKKQQLALANSGKQLLSKGYRSMDFAYANGMVIDMVIENKITIWSVSITNKH